MGIMKLYEHTDLKGLREIRKAFETDLTRAKDDPSVDVDFIVGRLYLANLFIVFRLLGK